MTTRYDMLLEQIGQEQDLQAELANGMDSDDIRMYRFYASESRAADLSNLAVAEQQRIANLIALANIHPGFTLGGEVRLSLLEEAREALGVDA